MRNYDEMMKLINDTAKANEKILAAYLCGSRANPADTVDNLSDYDVVYVVDEMPTLAKYMMDRDWFKVFGEPAIVQEPSSMYFGWAECGEVPDDYAWLMLFKDGTRIDLTMVTAECASFQAKKDRPIQVLFDEQGILKAENLGKSNRHPIKKIEKALYKGCCNEFWWTMQNVAKGAARGQYPYAFEMLNTVTRLELEKMIDWYVAIEHGFDVNLGKFNKYLANYLDDWKYAEYLKTYSSAEPDEILAALIAASNIFSKVAQAVADEFGYEYNFEDENNVRAYCRGLLM
ncbi:MAG: aminoglycoside 6-adenylyltransferase [Lactobacillales bacterium]|jgi:aminoglycoside 6-adenylyltransferase|nr:aminoglycoside 6-adenylyltransferase [Lactobacillales bacterium]